MAKKQRTNETITEVPDNAPSAEQVMQEFNIPKHHVITTDVKLLSYTLYVAVLCFLLWVIVWSVQHAWRLLFG